MSFRRGAPLILGGTSVFIAAVVVACTAVVQQATPLEPAPATPLPVVTEVSPQASFQVAAADEAKVLDLTQFRPLLARQELSAVASLVQSGELVDAVAEMERILLASESAPVLERARLNYLMGDLALRAELPQRALLAWTQAYELGEPAGFLLCSDARLKSAQLQLALGHPELSLAALDEVDPQDTLALLELRAQALVRLERVDDAELAWQALLAQTPQGSSAHHRSLVGHAQALWAQASGKREQEKKALATKQLALAQLGLEPSDPIYQQVEELKASWKVSPQVRSTDELLFGLGSLIDKHAFEEAEALASQIMLSKDEANDLPGCRLAYFRGKILAGLRKWGEAADAVTAVLNRCASDPGLHASMLFNAGKYSAADGRDSAAVRYYEELETKYKANSLADDARLRRAKSYKDMGSEARFVSLLSEMPDDYPHGDMTMEGVLLLAIDQMFSRKWSEAASVLQRAADIVRPHDSARGHEYAGTERYFLARCLSELGEEERALSEYESLIVDVPLSYYMLHAYSRLLEADKDRAKEALRRSLEQAKKAPFEYPYREEFASDDFKRAMELLMVGDFERGRVLLRELDSGPDGKADESLLWGIALLFDRAGDAHFSHQLARGRLTDWLSHYPEGDWTSPWEIGFPRPYLEVVQRESAATGVPPWLIYGVMREESTFVPDIQSHANAYGLMQIIPPTASGIGRKYNLPHSVAALKVPRYNVAIGSRVLAELLKRFKKNPLLSIPGYNAGPGRPGRWLSERPNIDFDLWVESIPYRETRRYTKRVLASRAAYAFIYYRDRADSALVLPKRLNLN